MEQNRSINCNIKQNIEQNDFACKIIQKGFHPFSLKYFLKSITIYNTHNKGYIYDIIILTLGVYIL